MRGKLLFAIAICCWLWGTEARAEIVIIHYTGTVGYYNVNGFPPDSNKYDYILGPFTLTTTVDTGTSPTFSFSAGLAPAVYPNSPPSIPDYATGSFGTWGGYGVRMDLTGSAISQTFYSLQGGPGYFDVQTPYITLEATIGGG